MDISGVQWVLSDEDIPYTSHAKFYTGMHGVVLVISWTVFTSDFLSLKDLSLWLGILSSLHHPLAPLILVILVNVDVLEWNICISSFKWPAIYTSTKFNSEQNLVLVYSFLSFTQKSTHLWIFYNLAIWIRVFCSILVIIIGFVLKHLGKENCNWMER